MKKTELVQIIKEVLQENKIIGDLVWKKNGEDLESIREGNRYLIYPGTSGFILQANGKNVCKGTLATCKAFANDHFKKDIETECINESHSNTYYPKTGDKVRAIYGGKRAIYQGDNFVDEVTNVIDNSTQPFVAINFKRRGQIKDYGDWSFENLNAGIEQGDFDYDTSDKEVNQESINKSKLIQIIQEVITELKKDPNKKYKIKIERSGTFGNSYPERFTEGTLAELINYFHYTLEVGKSWEREKGNKKINMNPKTIQDLIKNVENAKDNSASNGYGGYSYSVVEDTKTESINEYNVKKEKEPISAQLGVLMSDGSVETIKIMTGGSNIESILKSNYSTQKQLQTLLDYGDVEKLGNSSGNTTFLIRDKKKKSGTGAKLKNDIRGFVAVAKSNHAKKVYLFDLAKKEWKIVTNAKIDTLLPNKEK